MRREEQQLWAKICDEFDMYLDLAKAYELLDSFRELVERTRREEVSVWDWKELLDDLADRVSRAEDYNGLGDRQDELGLLPRRTPVDRHVDNGFGCPGDRCGRQVRGGLLDPKPWCPVLAKDMTTLT